MQHAKQDALETVGKLPDETDMDEIMYRLYVLDKLRKGQEPVEQIRPTQVNGFFMAIPE